ncbi:hypothetical protein F511_11464 [Dorcoceras hygrometricum]|uniref:Uncharacterized protein n=1 Tax=Dorcoceras hygrometricum TaxID=472368 RepID=A0A2Z7D3S2_9LAMI|nr:hypothetical protein F511_11464 [Dorcoceras hygrometricum]
MTLPFFHCLKDSLEDFEFYSFYNDLIPTAATVRTPSTSATPAASCFRFTISNVFSHTRNASFQADVFIFFPSCSVDYNDFEFKLPAVHQLTPGH